MQKDMYQSHLSRLIRVSLHQTMVLFKDCDIVLSACCPECLCRADLCAGCWVLAAEEELHNKWIDCWIPACPPAG